MTVLFCPFCRESFEGETRCPAHELNLVPFDRLPVEESARELGADERIELFDRRWGRGPIAAGSVAVLVGFYSPLFRVRAGAREAVFTTWEAARGPAPNLYFILFAAGFFLFLLLGRRTRRQLAGARAAALALSSMPLFSLAYTIVRVREGAAQWLREGTADARVSVEYAALFIVLGCLSWIVSSTRLGRGKT